MSIKKLVLTLVSLAFAFTARAEEWQQLDGHSDTQQEFQEVVATDPGEWSALWKKLHGPESEPPLMRRGETVVGVILGSRSHSSRIALQVTGRGETLLVRYAEIPSSQPQADDGLAATTHPYAFQRVPASRRRDDVRFEGPADGVSNLGAPEQDPQARDAVSQGVTRAGTLLTSFTGNGQASLDERFLQTRFDNAAGRAGTIQGTPALLAAADGPPGSGGGGPPGSGRGGPPGSGRGGPPGSGGGPPGSGGGGPPGSGRGGPPGSGGGGPSHPPSTRPPSRPAPVIRTVPAPPPNWWNTIERDITWWDAPPLNLGRDSFDNSTLRYVTRWYPWPRTFVDSENTVGEQSFLRNSTNQDDPLSADLESRRVTTTKQCWYRAHYNMTWVEGGFGGSHWEEEFSYWEAACYRDRSYGRPHDRRVTVRFDMGGKTLHPWERERVRITFDGSDVRAHVSNPSYEYTETSNNGRQVELRAGRRIPTPPDTDGVSVELQAAPGGLTLVIKDKWSAHYPNETLEVRVEVKKDSERWWRRDTVEYDETSRIQSTETTEVNIPAGRGKYYINSWSFRRANSAVSTSNWIYKGRGNTVTK